jgi:hypothetical protein
MVGTPRRGTDKDEKGSNVTEECPNNNELISYASKILPRPRPPLLHLVFRIETFALFLVLLDEMDAIG